MTHFNITLSLLLLVAAAPATAKVTVTTDKPVYVGGEVVTITIHNSGPGDVAFDVYPLYMIISSDTGRVIFGWDRVAQSTVFPAGHSEQFTRDTSVAPDPLGQYAVFLNLHLGVDVWTVYQLRSSVGIEAAAWGSVKALFQ